MGTELYLIKPNTAGELPRDIRDIVASRDDDADAHPWEGDVQIIGSLKWAAWRGAERRSLQDFDLVASSPIPPDELRARSVAALRSLLAELGELDPHYRWMADDAGDDVESLFTYLFAFEREEDWVWGEESARQRAFKMAREWSSLPALLCDLIRAGENGFWGYWSY